MSKKENPKNRIIFVPQLPVRLRYTEWWVKDIPKEFRKRGFEVIVLGNEMMQNTKLGDPQEFAPVNESIRFETEQVNEYMNMDITDNDILFNSDLSFPGLFHHVLFHKRPKLCYCFCHATSRNNLDYFAEDKYIKYPIEQGVAKIYDTVFVGSHYHKNKLEFYNTMTTYVPFPPFLSEYNKNIKKKNDIISVARPTPQKCDKQLEKRIEKKFGKIKRFKPQSWEEYYKNIAESKIMLISSAEETFGYQVVDAITNGCIPIAPNDYAYPELLQHRYLYDDEEMLEEKIKYFLKTYKQEEPVFLLCREQMNYFYNKITKVMKNAVSSLS